MSRLLDATLLTTTFTALTQLPSQMSMGHAEIVIAQPDTTQLIVATHPGQDLFLNVGDPFIYYHEATTDGIAEFNLMRPLPADAKLQVWCNRVPAHLIQHAQPEEFNMTNVTQLFNHLTMSPKHMPTHFAEILIGTHDLIIATHPGQDVLVNVGDAYNYFVPATSDGIARIHLMTPLPPTHLIRVWCDLLPATLALHFPNQIA